MQENSFSILEHTKTQGTIYSFCKEPFKYYLYVTMHQPWRCSTMLIVNFVSIERENDPLSLQTRQVMWSAKQPVGWRNCTSSPLFTPTKFRSKR